MLLPSITENLPHHVVARTKRLVDPENVQILAGILDAVIAPVACRPARAIVDYVSKRVGTLETDGGR